VNRLAAYAQQTRTWTRIEMLIAAYDGTISRIEQARELLEKGETLKAQPLLLRSQRIVLELYAGVDLNGGTIPENMQKLYLFVLNCIGMGPSLDLPAAVDILRNIRSGLDSIRDQANQLERSGQLAPVNEHSQLLRHIVA
jgi:flagellar secretion chaperone FliS